MPQIHIFPSYPHPLSPNLVHPSPYHPLPSHPSTLTFLLLSSPLFFLSLFFPLQPIQPLTRPQLMDMPFPFPFPLFPSLYPNKIQPSHTLIVMSTHLFTHTFPRALLFFSHPISLKMTCLLPHLNYHAHTPVSLTPFLHIPHPSLPLHLSPPTPYLTCPHTCLIHTFPSHPTSSSPFHQPAPTQ